VDLYGRQLRIQFLRRLRGERRFDTTHSLIAQMEEDVKRTRSLLASGAA
jgi:riboflavin kinase/FMN adenylyltransferase